MNKLLRDKKAIIVFIAPAFLLFTFVLFVPICQSIYYSFCDYNALTPPEFVGLKNYRKMFKDDTMVYAMKNSIFFLIFSCISQLIMGLILAGLLTNIKKGRNFFKNVIYLPCVMSSAALGLLWMFIFSPKLGINQILAKFGIEGPLWLMDIKGFIILPMWVIAYVALWQYVGQSMMLYMAQISGIDKSLYEA
ncbi:MAG: sugar ABC transporter permease [Lachnospiraceae bacterium]|jgi:raffinose/stachyose/melibiose transport system permease protein